MRELMRSREAQPPKSCVCWMRIVQQECSMWAAAMQRLVKAGAWQQQDGPEPPVPGTRRQATSKADHLWEPTVD